MADYDLICLGGGNAGQAAAGIAREADWKVLVIETREMGGTCPLRGCVPKKVLVAAAETLDTIARAGTHKITVGEPALDWPALMGRKQGFIDGVPESFEQSLTGRGIDVVYGKGRFVDGHTVEVDGKRYTGRKILVATGSRPRPLPIPGMEHAITSDDLLELDRRPESLVFVGAGVIAFEFSHVLARAGTRVTLLEVMPRPLPALDEDAVARLTAATEALGVQILTGVKVDGITEDGGKLTVAYTDGNGIEASIEAESVANGAGRIADLDDLNLEAAGIEHEGLRITTDTHLCSTSNPDVYVAGDALAGTLQLSPVATYEGWIVGHNLVKDTPRSPDYSAIPAVVFTLPALASVGLTEAQAKDKGFDIEVQAQDLTDWRSARTYGENTAFAKTLVDKSSGRILGAHLVGHGAAETIHAFALAMKHDLPADALKDFVYAYPTFHSDIKYLL